MKHKYSGHLELYVLRTSTIIIAITKKYFYIEKMSTSAAASVAVFEYDREAIRVKARLISMTKGLAHDMFSRIF